jgi:hypothetical protein
MIEKPKSSDCSLKNLRISKGPDQIPNSVSLLRAEFSQIPNDVVHVYADIADDQYSYWNTKGVAE